MGISVGSWVVSGEGSEGVGSAGNVEASAPGVAVSPVCCWETGVTGACVGEAPCAPEAGSCKSPQEAVTSNNPVRTGHRMARTEACRYGIPVVGMSRAGGLVVDITERYIEEKLLRAARVVVTVVLIILACHGMRTVNAILSRPQCVGDECAIG